MVASGGKGLRLRFGHDDVVLPFAFILGFPEARGATDDMKFLMNENETSIPVKTDVAPYYPWQDVKRYWAGDC